MNLYPLGVRLISPTHIYVIRDAILSAPAQFTGGYVRELFVQLGHRDPTSAAAKLLIQMQGEGLIERDNCSDAASCWRVVPQRRTA